MSDDWLYRQMRNAEKDVEEWPEWLKQSHGVKGKMTELKDRVEEILNISFEDFQNIKILQDRFEQFIDVSRDIIKDQQSRIEGLEERERALLEILGYRDDNLKATPSSALESIKGE